MAKEQKNETPVKIYRLRTSTRLTIKLRNAEGEKIPFEFTGGSRAPKFRPGTLLIREPWAQEAIESHPWNPSKFYLDEERTNGYGKERPEETPRKVAHKEPEEIVLPPVEIRAQSRDERIAEVKAAKAAEKIPEEVKEEIAKAAENGGKTQPPDTITTVPEAADWLNENIGVAKSKVNTKKLIKAVADKEGLVFSGIEF